MAKELGPKGLEVRRIARYTPRVSPEGPRSTFVSNSKTTELTRSAPSLPPPFPDCVLPVQPVRVAGARQRGRD